LRARIGYWLYAIARIDLRASGSVYADATGSSLQLGKRMDLRTLEPVAVLDEGYAVWSQPLPKSDRNAHPQAARFYGCCIKTRATGHRPVYVVAVGELISLQ
jgi:hypothetical protein